MSHTLRAWGWIAALLLLLICAALLHTVTWRNDVRRSDIYYLYLDGQRLAAGENPYARVLQGNMRENDKYTTYFPAFIELSYFTQRLGLVDFDPWLAFWRWVFLFTNLGITALLFWAFYSQGAPLLGIIAAAFWAFNRWTVFILQVSGMDFLPLLLLLVSLLLLPGERWRLPGERWRLPGERWRLLPMLLFGLSLAMKQVAIFLVPLYLIYAFQWVPAGHGILPRFRAALTAALAIGAPVLVTSLPFLAWDWLAFVKSILFSATRSQYQYAPTAASVDMALGLGGVAARLPMLAAMALVYWAAWRGKLPLLSASLLVMAVFAGFNAVFFDQYMVWFIILLPLALLEIIRGGRFSS